MVEDLTPGVACLLAGAGGIEEDIELRHVFEQGGGQTVHFALALVFRSKVRSVDRARHHAMSLQAPRHREEGFAKRDVVAVTVRLIAFLRQRRQDHAARQAPLGA